MAAKRSTFIGNRLEVDFVNTIYPRGVFCSWNDLVAFLEATGTIGRGEASRLRARGRREPEFCARAFEQAIMLRSVLREALAAIEARRPIPPHCAGAINTVLRSLEGYAQLMRAGKGWRLGFVARSLDPLQAMAPIAHAAAELFEKADTAPVPKCANPECVLYFYDTSRTGRHRWCSMAICGNRHKVAAFAQRRASR